MGGGYAVKNVCSHAATPLTVDTRSGHPGGDARSLLMKQQ
jgi:hypothetical protein